MNRANVTRLLTYLVQLKAEGEEDKWWMGEYLSNRGEHNMLYPSGVTNWHCGTAGCLAGSWAIIKVRDGSVPPETMSDLIFDFRDDFELATCGQKDHVVLGDWSPHGVTASLDEAIAYLRLCLERNTMDVSLDT
jgi:hypothetical protein